MLDEVRSAILFLSLSYCGICCGGGVVVLRLVEAMCYDALLCGAL